MSKKGREINTLKNYTTDLNCFKEFLLKVQKKTDLSNLSLGHILEYGNYLEQKYHSVNSKRRRIQALRIFFDYLVSIGIFKENFVRSLPSSPKFLDIPRPVSNKDIEVFLKELHSELELHNGPLEKLLSLRNLIIFYLIFYGGLKVSDLEKLKKRQLLNKKNDTRVMIYSKKGEPRTIPLHESFSNIFSIYLDLLETQQMEFEEILFNANPYRILSGGLSPRGIELIFKDYAKSLKIEITPKSLRQACIFHWLQQNKKDGVIKTWLGLAPNYSLSNFHKHKENFIYQDYFKSLNFDHEIS